MEIILFGSLLGIVVVAVLFISRGKRTVRRTVTALREERVASAIQQLNLGTYTTFNGLVIRASGPLRRTTINHVVVSPYGIFCIDTNSRRRTKNHKSVLEALLHGSVKAPIHSYVVFPNATNMKIDSLIDNQSIEAVMRSIASHHKWIYNVNEYQHILTTLVRASTASGQ